VSEGKLLGLGQLGRIPMQWSTPRVLDLGSIADHTFKDPNMPIQDKFCMGSHSFGNDECGSVTPVPPFPGGGN
jgi:hypothetical protein